jgi:hypothetical protein
VSGISVCDDGAEVVDVGELCAVGFRLGHYALFSLLAVVKELSREEVVDFVGDGGLDAVSYGVRLGSEGRT